MMRAYPAEELSLGMNLHVTAAARLQQLAGKHGAWRPRPPVAHCCSWGRL